MASSGSVPRPILKGRGAATEAPVPRTESKQLLHIDPGLFQPVVRYPSTSSLTCIFLVHSPSTYDRSPIAVSPNKLTLPELGCPGRTYLPGDERLSAAKELASRNNGGRGPRGRSPSGRHPRSHARLSADSGQSESSCNTEKVQSEDPGLSRDLEESLSPLPSPQATARALLEVSSTLTSLCISQPSRPPSPLPFRARNYMTLSRSSSPANSCGTSPASSRSNSLCRDILMFTPSTRRRRNLSARPCQRRSTSDQDINMTSSVDSSLLNIDGYDDGCLGGF